MQRALLVGINEYPSAPLHGCVNDVQDMAEFLVERCGFDMNDVRLLTDARATTQGILERIGWLLTGVRLGDRIFFQYSGHGAQMATRNPQGEVDGLDEVICPVDFDWSDDHVIRDKDFDRIFSAVPPGVEFVWVSDSCHSGDLSRDIPHPGRLPRSMPLPADMDWRLRTARKAGLRALGMRSAGGLQVALVSGCAAEQTSADAVFSGRSNGALTYYLLQVLKDAASGNSPLAGVVEQVRLLLRNNGFEQIPALEGSEEISDRPFLML